ncbi:MAG: DNA recombination protein RmuC [Clostridia bacterium]
MEIINLVFSGIVVILLLIFLLKKNKTKSFDKIVDIKGDIANLQNQYLQLSQLTLSAIKDYNNGVINMLSQSTSLQNQQLAEVQSRLEAVSNNSVLGLKRATEVLEVGLKEMAKGNETKLEQMRETVAEKLEGSLEKRLSESFNVINVRLQSVYEGLGEMKQLATGVGDLKRVLTNVKTRGVWGEVSLNSLLEQMLAPNQYATQVEIHPGERVDFVVYMPGKDDKNVMLSIDAKFPMEDYSRLCDAFERGDTSLIETCGKALEKRIKDEAKSIKEKYISPPETMDFAIMYLATEGLYAEIQKRPGLAENLQQQNKIMVCGPSTLSAFLSSLQMGFKTLAIEKRSSEIWFLLGTFKQEFSKFVDLLTKTQKKLGEASSSIESATKKSITIQKKLKNVVLDEGKIEVDNNCSSLEDEDQ